MVWLASRTVFWVVAITGLAVANGLGFLNAGWVFSPSLAWLLPPIHIAVPWFRYKGLGFQLRDHDVSLRFVGNRTYSGMNYQVAADVPVMDSGAVATLADGALSPLFLVAAANEDGVPDADPLLVHRQLPDAQRYLELPDDLDPAIKAKATELTAKFSTDFNKGLALEYWFRENGGFVYDLEIDVSRGHGPEALASWREAGVGEVLAHPLFEPDDREPALKSAYAAVARAAGA